MQHVSHGLPDKIDGYVEGGLVAAVVQLAQGGEERVDAAGQKRLVAAEVANCRLEFVNLRNDVEKSSTSCCRLKARPFSCGSATAARTHTIVVPVKTCVSEWPCTRCKTLIGCFGSICACHAWCSPRSELWLAVGHLLQRVFDGSLQALAGIGHVIVSVQSLQTRWLL